MSPFLSRSTAALIALNAASSAFAATPTSNSYIALYTYGLQIPLNPNTNYVTVQGSSTKWIGKNTEYLTDEIVTSTSSGTTTTSTKDIGVGASTTTASASGSSVPALGFTISPETVSDLESVAAAACGGGAKKRQVACAISADALAAKLEATLAVSLSAADVAALQGAVGSAAAFSAASIIMAGAYLASKSIPMNFGVNVPSLKAAASKATTASTSSSSSSSSAQVTTITNAIDADQAIETDTAALLAQGSYIISQALHTPDPFLDSTGQTFSCSNYADPDNSMTMPNDYCVCQDGKSYSVTSGPQPCPYTAAPKSTVVFTTKSSSTPTPTSTSATPTNTPGSGITIGQATCADPAAPTFARDAASSAISVVCASAVKSAWSYAPAATLSPGDISKNSFYSGSLSQKFSDVTNGDQELAITVDANKIGCSPGQDFSVDFKAMGQDKCVSQWMATVDGCDTNSADKHGGVVYQDCLLWTAGMVKQ